MEHPRVEYLCINPADSTVRRLAENGYEEALDLVAEGWLGYCISTVWEPIHLPKEEEPPTEVI
jgi:hypothetical protein